MGVIPRVSGYMYGPLGAIELEKQRMITGVER